MQVDTNANLFLGKMTLTDEQMSLILEEEISEKTSTWERESIKSEPQIKQEQEIISQEYPIQGETRKKESHFYNVDDSTSKWNDYDFVDVKKEHSEQLTIVKLKIIVDLSLH